MVDRSPQSGQKFRRGIFVEAETDHHSEPLLESVSRLTTSAGLEVAADPPGSKCRELPIEIAVDIS